MTSTNLKQQETNPAMFLDGSFYCPMCNDYFKESEYLKTVINTPKTLWLANMVTHYRHNHITSWNKCWGRYQGHWFGDYDEEKSKVNERAKRQIIRKCLPFLKAQSIIKADFEGLEYNSPETMALIKKKL